jgi:hypothetical protein
MVSCSAHVSGIHATLIANPCYRDVTPPGQSQTALGAAASAAVPSANDLDTSEDVEMAETSTAMLNGIFVS